MNMRVMGRYARPFSGYAVARMLRHSGAVLTLGVALSGAAQAQPLKTYIVKDLGTLGGESRAMGVNYQGYAVGYYLDGLNRQRPFRHDFNSGMVDLGTFNGTSGSGIAYGINDSGEVVGFATNPAGHKRAFRTGAFASILPANDLGTLGGNEAEARAISNSGYIAGSAMLSSGRYRGFRYFQGEMRNLGLLGSGNGSSHGLSVNESGQVAGHSDKNSQHGKAFRYNGDNPVVLQDLGLVVRDSEGANINGAGSVIGTEEQGSAVNGFLFQDGQPLANLGSNVVANGINDAGVYVGQMPSGANTHAFVNRGNGMEDMMDLLTGPEATAFTGAADSMGATAIAQSGIIVGWGDGASGRRAIKMIPFNVTLNSLSPSLFTAGSGDVTITAQGWGFSRACKISWNGTPLTTTFVSVSQLTATVPAALIANPTTALVTIMIPTAAGSSNALPATVGGYNITATPNAVEFGGQINVSWSVPPGTGIYDWVGLYRVGDDNRSWIAYSYTSGAVSGSTTFTAPSSAGQYEVRYLLNNGYESRASAAPITVSARAGYTVTTTATTVSPGAMVNVSWTVPAGRPQYDWVGLFRVGDDNRMYLAYVFTGGAGSGSTNFAAPSQAGTYEFRYLLDDGYTDSARSSSFTVLP